MVQAPCFFPLSATEKPGNNTADNHRTLKGGKRKVDWLGDSKNTGPHVSHLPQGDQVDDFLPSPSMAGVSHHNLGCRTTREAHFTSSGIEPYVDSADQRAAEHSES